MGISKRMGRRQRRAIAPRATASIRDRSGVELRGWERLAEQMKPNAKRVADFQLRGIVERHYFERMAGDSRKRSWPSSNFDERLRILRVSPRDAVAAERGQSPLAFVSRASLRSALESRGPFMPVLSSTGTRKTLADRQRPSADSSRATIPPAPSESFSRAGGLH